MEMTLNSAIYVAGHTGLVGSAISRALERQGYQRLIGRTRHQLDLLDARAVEHFFSQEKPDYVFVAAAKVGGILANSQYPADFLYDNLHLQNNLIHQAKLAGVKKLLLL